ncbi:hypothetical protein, partial [uncultured Cardiobacterium sp.]|uniref:hypothetical protein n=1 Tax=uncultured Cardiobacterium sp. TaxID=417619 RepID=UPI00261FD115
FSLHQLWLCPARHTFQATPKSFIHPLFAVAAVRVKLPAAAARDAVGMAAMGCRLYHDGSL